MSCSSFQKDWAVTRTDPGRAMKDFYDHVCNRAECPGLPPCPLLMSVLDGEDELDIRFMQLKQEYDMQAGATTKKRDTFVAASLPFTDFNDRELRGFSWSMEFSEHRFVARWQNHAYDTMQSLLTDGTIIAVIDFSMNWSGGGQHGPVAKLLQSTVRDACASGVDHSTAEPESGSVQQTVRSGSA